MKDIDFDELDKAVNSLMATTKPAPAAASQPAAPVATPVVSPISPAPAPVPASQLAAPTPEPSAIPVTVRPAAPAVKRPAGRFMDMVSKPSDAKPRAAAAPTASREGISISPRSADAATVTPPISVPSAPEPAPVQDRQPSSPPVMPDPIDMQTQPFGATEAPDSEPIQPAAPSNPPLGSAESPFLTDAKVEKRPLNSDPLDAPSLDLQDELFGTAAPGADEPPVQDNQNDADEPPAVPQVAELSSDLVAIEADEKIDLTQAVDTADAASQVTVPSVPLGASSIAQQYTTQPSSGDQSHAAIYDASQYPEPVTHPAKSKSGWLWILWVVLLLGVGAGGALLLYNLGIIP